MEKEQRAIEANMAKIAEATRKEIQGKAKIAFDSLDSAINDSAKNLQDLQKELANVGKQLDSLENDIARRALAIEQELADIQRKQQQ